VEGIRALLIAMILHGQSNSYHHQIVYLPHVDGGAQLNCSIYHTLELPLGVAPHLQGEDPMAEQGTNHPCRHQSPILQFPDRIQQQAQMPQL